MSIRFGYVTKSPTKIVNSTEPAKVCMKKNNNRAVLRWFPSENKALGFSLHSCRFFTML